MTTAAACGCRPQTTSPRNRDVVYIGVQKVRRRSFGITAHRRSAWHSALCRLQNVPDRRKMTGFSPDSTVHECRRHGSYYTNPEPDLFKDKSDCATTHYAASV